MPATTRWRFFAASNQEVALVGMVTVTVAFDRVGEFLDLCEDTIVRVEQDDVKRTCRFTLHVPEMASCEAQVLVVSRDDGVSAWLVPVVPVQQTQNTIKAADVARMWQALRNRQDEAS